MWLVCLWLSLLVTAGSGCRGSSPESGASPLQAGDLLFQDLDGSPFYDAIEKVTWGHQGANLTHLGMVVHDVSGKTVVLEAALEGVKTVSLDEFLSRSRDRDGNPKVLVGRLTKEHRHLIAAAAQEALALLGKPYDTVFDIDNDEYYCSELVHVAFQRANGGVPLFHLHPMTFIDPDTNETFPAWTDYFADLNVPIPEGRPGLNPGGMSRSPVLQIVHAYGHPGGWNSQAGRDP